jgi:hypothetical protein
MTFQEASRHIQLADLPKGARDAALTILDIAQDIDAELVLLRFLRSRAAVELETKGPSGRYTHFIAEPDGGWDMRCYARTAEVSHAG